MFARSRCLDGRPSPPDSVCWLGPGLPVSGASLPISKPLADLFWIKAQGVLAPPAPEALAPTPDKETLVTAGGGQGPGIGTGLGQWPKGLATYRPFSQHLLLPQEDRSRG